jgi:lysophospholipase L1-like esterase
MRLVIIVCLAWCIGFLNLNSSAENSAAKPVPLDEGWLQQHEHFNALAKAGDIDILFLGDSLVTSWMGDGVGLKARGKAVWDKEYATKHAALFGISGDRTQHLLWRISHGELDGLHPRVVILVIGVNNTGYEPKAKVLRNTTDEVIEAMQITIAEVRNRLPDSTLIVMGLFPKGGRENPARAQITAVNKALKLIADNHKLIFLDIGNLYVTKQGDIIHELMPDSSHPSAQGYQIWADALRGPLNQILQ